MQNAYTFCCYEFKWSRGNRVNFSCDFQDEVNDSGNERCTLYNHYNRKKIQRKITEQTKSERFIHNLSHTKLNRCDFVILKPFQLLDLPTYILYQVCRIEKVMKNGIRISMESDHSMMLSVHKACVHIYIRINCI